VSDDELLDDILVENDPELPEGKVLVASSKSGGQRKFHTDPDCQYVSDRHTEWDREEAEEWDLKKCSKCDGTKPTGGY